MGLFLVSGFRKYTGKVNSEDFLLIANTIGSMMTNVTLLGGSTFDIFAYSTLSTVGCTYTDTRNNNYQVQCQLPCLSHKCNEELQLQRLHTQKQHNDDGYGYDCVHVTAILSHEHYDSFAEISLTTEEPQLRVVLQDNQTYCMTTSTTRSEEVKSAGSDHQHQHQHQLQQERVIHTSPLPSWGLPLLPPDVRVYSGIWVTSDMLHLHKELQHQHQQRNSTVVASTPHSLLLSLLSMYNSNNSSMNNMNSNSMELKTIDPSISSLYALKRTEHLTASDSYTKDNPYVSYSTDILHSDDVSRLPPQIAMVSPYVLSDRYTFLPMLLNGFNASMSADTSIKNRRFHFIGASHMRYNFDGVIDILFGSDVIRNFQRKHNDLIIEKFYRYDRTNFISSLFANLKESCKLETSTSTSTPDRSEDSQEAAAVVFLQTGHWDLFLNGLRFIVANHTNYSPGYKLLQLFNDIFTGNLPCPGISHIVWMTAVPYPLCFSHRDHTPCEIIRGQRYNANIRAMNEYFLRGIVSSYANATSTHTSTTNKKKNNIRLSVIDAYSIIYPRIIYDENNELICSNHYSCREDGQRPRYTPGGAAVLQSILSVIGNGL
eukprot:gene7370-15051_t